MINIIKKSNIKIKTKIKNIINIIKQKKIKLIK